MRKAATILTVLAAGTAFLVALAVGAGAQTTPDKNCSDFATQQDAQAFYDQHKNDQPGNPDPDHLDADGDGVACEGLPSGSTAPVATAAPISTPAPAIPKNGAETGVMALSGLSLLEAGYGMTLLARRYGVKRRNVPLYLLKKLVSAGKSGQAAIPVGDDLYLVHSSALAATAEDYYTYIEVPDEEHLSLVFEDDEDDDVSVFMPPPVMPHVSVYAALAKGAEVDEPPLVFDEPVEPEIEPDPWDDEFAWRV
jgi:hypothetical protein